MTNRLRGGAVAVLCSCVLLLGGCGHETPPDESGAVARLDEHRTLGAPITSGNLTVWPIHTDKPIDIGEFLTLQEAQERKVAVVRELGGGDPGQVRQGRVPQPDNIAPSTQPRQVPLQVNDQQLGGVDGAEVGRVVIENKGTLPILVVAGTIIDGGKQDRQIGQDFVIAAGETVKVDAFCVEHGRWQAQVTEFASLEGGSAAGGGGRLAAQFAASKTAGIAPKLVRAAAQYEKDQSAVWINVQSSNRLLKTSNGTQTLMGAIELADEATLKQRATYEKIVADAFARLAETKDAPVGFAYAVNGKPVTVRTFAHERILRAQLPLFLKAMAVEAHMASGEADATTRVTAADVLAMVRGIQANRNEELALTAASNSNGYFKNDVGFNARCYLKPGLLKKMNIAVGPDKVIITEDWTAK